jgi:hypothetical protein
LGFAGFVQDSFGRKFVAIIYSPETCDSLAAFCEQHVIDWQYDRTIPFHTTVYHSESETTRALPNGLFGGPIITTSPSHYEVLGDYCLCLILQESRELIALRASLNEQYGLYDKWPTYKPHIALCYGWNKPVPELPLPTFPLLSYQFKVDTINDEL